MSNNQRDQRGDDARPQRLTVWQVIKSTAAAFFGVQTPEARQRDFQHGNPMVFIVAGIVGTALFVLVLVIVVNLVLAGADTG